MSSSDDKYLEQLQQYQHLLEMGFDETSAFKAAKKYPKNINRAVNYITYTQDNDEKRQNPITNVNIKQNASQTIIPLSKQPAIQILLKSFISVMKLGNNSALLNSLISLLDDVDFSLDSQTLQTILDARLAEYVGETRLNAFLDLQNNYWQLLKQSINAMKPFERQSKVNYNLIQKCRQQLKHKDIATIQYVQNLGRSLKTWLESQDKLKPLALEWSQFAKECQKENSKWKEIVTRNKNVRRELEKNGDVTKIIGWITVVAGITSSVIGIFLKQDVFIHGGVTLIVSGVGALTVKHQQFDKKLFYNKTMSVKVKVIQQSLQRMTQTSHNMDAILDQIKNTMEEAFDSLDELQKLINDSQSFEFQLEALSYIFEEFKDNGKKCITTLHKAQNKYINT